MKIEIPLSGARMIMASDGLWDHVTGRRAMRETRKLSVEECAESLVRLAEERSKEGEPRIKGSSVFCGWY